MFRHESHFELTNTHKRQDKIYIYILPLLFLYITQIVQGGEYTKYPFLPLFSLQLREADWTEKDVI